MRKSDTCNHSIITDFEFEIRLDEWPCLRITRENYFVPTAGDVATRSPSCCKREHLAMPEAGSPNRNSTSQADGL